MATPPLIHMSKKNPTILPEYKPNPRPDPSPKPRGRKGSKSTKGPGSGSGSGPQKKQPQRGMGVAQLERLRSLQDPNNNNPFPAHLGLAAHFKIPVQPGPDPRSSFARVIAGGSQQELPSIPNLELQGNVDHFSFKKKRVVGDDVGFIRERENYYADQIFPPNYGCNFAGFDFNYMGDNRSAIHGGFSGYGAGTSEVVAIHRKADGSGNVVMEYGFLPAGKSEANNNNNGGGWKMKNNNVNMMTWDDDNCKIMEDLNLKMGCSSNTSSSSPSSSSSLLSSLTTSTITTTNSLDLSLKLSY